MMNHEAMDLTLIKKEVTETSHNGGESRSSVAGGEDHLMTEEERTFVNLLNQKVYNMDGWSLRRLTYYVAHYVD